MSIVPCRLDVVITAQVSFICREREDWRVNEDEIKPDIARLIFTWDWDKEDVIIGPTSFLDNFKEEGMDATEETSPTN